MAGSVVVDAAESGVATGVAAGSLVIAGSVATGAPGMGAVVIVPSAAVPSVAMPPPAVVPPAMASGAASCSRKTYSGAASASSWVRSLEICWAS